MVGNGGSRATGLALRRRQPWRHRGSSQISRRLLFSRCCEACVVGNSLELSIVGQTGSLYLVMCGGVRSRDGEVPAASGEHSTAVAACSAKLVYYSNLFS